MRAAHMDSHIEGKTFEVKTQYSTEFFWRYYSMLTSMFIRSI